MTERHLTADDRAALRFQAEQRRHALIRQRILGMRASNRTMPVREIAYRVGVSAPYVEEVTGEKSPPESLS